MEIRSNLLAKTENSWKIDFDCGVRCQKGKLGRIEGKTSLQSLVHVIDNIFLAELLITLFFDDCPYHHEQNAYNIHHFHHFVRNYNYVRHEQYVSYVHHDFRLPTMEHKKHWIP